MFLHCKSDKTLEHTSQRNCGYPIHGGVQGQTVGGSKQPGLRESVLVHKRGSLETGDVTTQTILWFLDCIRQAAPLQIMEGHCGENNHLQPMEDPMLEWVDVPEGYCDSGKTA